MAPVAVLLVVVSCTTAVMSETAEERTARYFDSVRKNPSLLHAFLEQMPKGGDLHNHTLGPQTGKISSSCRMFLDASEKARVQWQLEKEFGNFEQQY